MTNAQVQFVQFIFMVNAGLACIERFGALGKEIMGSTTNRGQAEIHGGDGGIDGTERSSFVGRKKMLRWGG